MIEIEDISLVSISLNDSQELIELMQAAYIPVYAYLWSDGGIQHIEKSFGHNQLAADLEMQDSYYYFVVCDGMKIGTLRFYFYYEDKKECMRLHRLYLLKNYSSRGIGKKILAYLYDLAKGREVSTINLEAIACHQPAVDFYQKNGFVEADNYEYYDLGMKEEYRMMNLMKKKVF